MTTSSERAKPLSGLAGGEIQEATAIHPAHPFTHLLAEAPPAPDDGQNPFTSEGFPPSKGGNFGNHHHGHSPYVWPLWHDERRPVMEI
ncbi:MAG: hypothetical protein CM15mP128_4200 [Methanobacteriota archaeon]|nr:MAG: hypothetical protein CM15mP128_4200 [Euryarchaeota archaeon]